MGEIISVECIEYDPRVVRIHVKGSDGDIYTVDTREEDYRVLALLPGFPPDPC